MSHFVTKASDNFVEECRSVMLLDNMNISHLIVHAQKVEESNVRRKNRKAKRAKSFESSFENGNFEF